MDFNPRKETSKAVVWISLPELPANLFAQKSILSIASSVGKPIAVDKATKDRSRPSMARVKVLVNLLDIHPSTIKIKIVDSKSGNISTFDQKIVIDNAPEYCTLCCLQGHIVKSCRRNQVNESVVSIHFDSRNKVDKLKGDARDFLNEKRASQKRIDQKKSLVPAAHNLKQVWKQKAHPIIFKDGQITNEEASPQCEKGKAGPDILSQQPITLASRNPPVPESLHSTKEVEEDNSRAHCKYDSNFDRGFNDSLNGAYSTGCSKVLDETDRLKKPMTSVSFKTINKSDFDLSIANSSFTKGSISGLKTDNAQHFGHDVLLRHFVSCKVTVPSIPSLANQSRETGLVPGESAGFSSKNSVISSDILASLGNFSPVGDNACTPTDEDIQNNFQVREEGISAHFKASEKRDCLAVAPVIFSPVGDNVSKPYDQVMEERISPDFETSDKRDHLADFAIDNEKLNLNGSVGSGVYSTDQSVMMQPFQAVVECLSLDCEDHQCKDISAQPSDQQQPISNDPFSVSNQLISDDQLELNRVSLKEENMQCSCEGSLCMCHHNVSIPIANRIDKPLLIQPIEQQQYQSNATVIDNATVKDKVDGVLDKEHFGDTEADRQYISDDHQVAAYSDSLKNKINKTDLKIVQSCNQTGTSKANSTLSKMESLNGNKIGGVIKKVNSFTPMSISNAYSGEDIIDNEDISSLEETNKHVIISSMKESVIKSKLWDQRPFRDEVNWDEDSSGVSSSEDENQLEYSSSGEESDNSIKPFTQPSQAKRNEIANPADSARGLNHNAPIFIPNKPATAYHPMEPKTGVTQKEQEQNAIIPYPDNSGNGYGSNSLGFLTPSKQNLEMEGRHLYEEGEEEDILTQCRINAARKGDLSPKYSNPNKNNHRRERSWDDRLIEHAAIRKLPMRMAKLKQVTQPSVTKPRKSKNKAS